MIKLIQSGLFGNGLVAVDNETMVRRYNECLEQIGLMTTSLQSFHIDGWGWSPEIADEQGNRHYLSHGPANPYGILISPEQASSSLYFPLHTFEWDIHHELFQRYGSQIDDITTQCGIWFELDQNILAYRTVQDLLMIENILITFHSVDGLMEAAGQQRALVSRFFQEANAWSDFKLREELISSARRFGDLRFRKVEIPPFPYNRIESFYTSAFNGVYVLKDSGLGKPLLILEGQESAVSGQLQHAHIEFNLSDPRLLGFLYGQRLISDDSDFHIRHPDLLEHQCNALLMRAISNRQADMSLLNLSSGKKKGLVNEMYQAGQLDDNYFEFEQIVRKVKAGENPDIPPQTALRNHFLHPAPGLSTSTQRILWQLLNRQLNGNELLSYTFDKVHFYNRYQKFSPGYQDWVISEILNNKGIYHKLMDL